VIIILIPLSNFYLAQLCWALHIKLLFFYLFQICFNVFSWQFLSRILWFAIWEKLRTIFILWCGDNFATCPGKRRLKLWLFRVNWLTFENSSLIEVFFDVKCVNIYDTLLGSKLLASLTHCDLVLGTQNEFYHFPRVRRGGEQLPSFLLLHIL
jgi:hypothetical protein